jgi:AraC family transcriptional regulator of adaptative response / DNA-3-methyladenine glycosylase II
MPVCKVRAPKPENCRFFSHAALAEAAGFRPCLRCRPELAPAAPGSPDAAWSTQDASAVLARQAAMLMEVPADGSDTPVSAASVAARLGISDRHLRRIFEAYWGTSPLRYLQTRRLLTAKQLLTDTRLPVQDVAHLSGFASVRRFNASFIAHYRLQPGTLRRESRSPVARSQSGRSEAAADTGFTFYAGYRPPFDVEHLLQFFAQRALAGVEVVDLAKLHISRSVRLQHHGQWLQGWVSAQCVPAQYQMRLRISPSLAPALPWVLNRLRAWLDLDADPAAIDRVLALHFPGTEGIRVPGTVDGFELAVRAILGQQITVQAARTLTQRLVMQWGSKLQDAPHGLSHCFPDALRLSQVDAGALGELGIVKQRQQAILALARAVAEGSLTLLPGAPVGATVQALVALPGIGPWTAEYIALRALRFPDAFPSGDVALHTALGVRNHPQAAAEAQRLSQAWRPWRGYATVRAWHLLSKPDLLLKT